jgi:hypothetical protein|tara:strand:+ start:3101 stop:3421 length:321 start_codon:yes stop_codon:yes gene_type:complete
MDLNKKNANKLADEISFRLLATKKHPDYDWLTERLSTPSERGSIRKFIEFSLIWYSQQMAIAFWMVGHVHLSLNVYQDLHEILASIGLNILVAIGFIIDYRKNGKK